MRFVSLVDSNYLPGIFALLQSIYENGKIESEDINFLIVHENRITKKIRDSLLSIGFKIEFLPRQELGDIKAITNQRVERFDYTFKKILLLSLDIDETVCFLDADLLCLNALTGIEKLSHFSAAPDIGINKQPEKILGYPMFNSGMFIFKPSTELYERIVEYYESSDNLFDFGDQQLLSWYFYDTEPNSVHLLDTNWNTLKRVYLHHSNVFDLSKIRFLHFVGRKPWELKVWQKEWWTYRKLNRLWWQYFYRYGGFMRYAQGDNNENSY